MKEGELLGKKEIVRNQERVIHQDGSEWSFPGAAQDGEYYPTETSNILEREDNNIEIVPDAFLFTRLGTMVEPVPEAEIKKFIAENSDKIDSELISVVETLCQDKDSFQIIQKFFQENGKLNVERFSRFSDEPLKISIGSGRERKEWILFHELLHYVFFRQKLILNNLDKIGGSDHLLISPIEERFNILILLKSGAVPDSFDIESLDNYTRSGSVRKKISEFIQANDLDGLDEYINNDFYHNFIYTGLVTPLSSVDFHKNARQFLIKIEGKRLSVREDYRQSVEERFYFFEDGESGDNIQVDLKDIHNLDFNKLRPHFSEEALEAIRNVVSHYQNDMNFDRAPSLNNEQIIDLVYLKAINACIFQQSFRLAIALARKKNIPVESAFREEIFQNSWREFLKQFIGNFEKGKADVQIRRTSQLQMDEIISKV